MAHNGDFVVIVVDDNMLLRSMRKRYFQLARAGDFSFVQVSLAVPLALSLARNATRPADRRIPEHIVRDTHDRNEVSRATRSVGAAHGGLGLKKHLLDRCKVCLCWTDGSVRIAPFERDIRRGSTCSVRRGGYPPFALLLAAGTRRLASFVGSSLA
jgi:hypothetical protein